MFLVTFVIFFDVFIYSQGTAGSGIWRNSQESTCAGVSFLIKLQAVALQLY